MPTKLSRRKSMGVHYTPGRLAEFVASRIVRHVDPTSGTRLRILDPACGEGALLEALGKELRLAWRGKAEVYGVEADAMAAAKARQRLSGWRDADINIIHADFLSLCANENGQSQLWDATESDPRFHRNIDIIIANPPYVRTQVLGASTARRLAGRFGLKGRVDLYHAFFVAMAESLRDGGMIGIITSNRFLSTLSGAALRRFLGNAFVLEELLDLGDSKLFDAAVLPAIFIGKRTFNYGDANERGGDFLRLYTCDDNSADSDIRQNPQDTVYQLLSNGKPGKYRVAEGCFELACGTINIRRDSSRVWALTTSAEVEWIKRVQAASAGVFSSLAKIRVGIKTTADEVFTRSDWDSLPVNFRPEDELLRPLLGHEKADRWRRRTGDTHDVRVLYPHEVRDGIRRPVDLDRYPRAKRYLEMHRERLERRDYVLEAGRRWYEIWVPQNPEDWKSPKIVFPDISPEPRFYWDESGSLVDGDSYWITVKSGVRKELLYLLLAVANSSLVSRFHDLMFNNRLYSGRRRYITQYVSQYPIPDPHSSVAQKLISVVEKFFRDHERPREAAAVRLLDEEADRLVNECFESNAGEFA
ncbi:MAG: Modification methylase PaeR7I [Phycisphaerae bacterium]|nr:Modification methylase PaeR7I [Phycisphaerae bacterium]